MGAPGTSLSSSPPATSESVAAVTNTRGGLLTASSGGCEWAEEALNALRTPRTTLALLSSNGVLHRPGSRAVWIGRNSLKAAVETTAGIHAEVRAAGDEHRSGGERGAGPDEARPEHAVAPETVHDADPIGTTIAEEP